jgi:WD40 repeat protein
MKISFSLLLILGISALYAQQPRLVLPVGHASAFKGVEFSKDSRLILTYAENDNIAKVWETATGRLIANLNGHTGPVITAHLSPNGMKVITASEDHTARVWDIASATCKLKLNYDSSSVVIIARFSPDGERILTCEHGEKTLFKLWDLEGNLLSDSNAYNYENITDAGFTGGGKYFYVKSVESGYQYYNQPFLSVFKIKDTKNYLRTRLDNEYLFDKAGTFLYRVDPDKVIRYNMDSSKPAYTLKIEGREIYHAILNADESKLLIISKREKTKIWEDTDFVFHVFDVNSGKQIAQMKNNRYYPVIFSPDGKLIISYYINTVRVWDAATGNLVTDHNLHFLDNGFIEVPGTNKVRHLFHKDGSSAIAGSQIYNLETGELMLTLKHDEKDIILFNPEGNLVFQAGKNGSASIWDLNKKTLKSKLVVRSQVISKFIINPGLEKSLIGLGNGKLYSWNNNTLQIAASVGEDEIITAYDYDVRGERIITATRSGTIKLWNAANGKLEKEVYQCNEAIRRLAINDHYIVVFTWSSRLLILEINKDSLLLDSILQSSVMKMKFDKSGTLLIMSMAKEWEGGTEYPNVCVYDIIQGKQVFNFDEKVNNNWDNYIFLEDIANEDGIVLTSHALDFSTWNLKNGKRIRRYRGHSDFIESVNFNHKGDRIVSVSRDSTVRVWDTRKSKELFKLKERFVLLNNAVFSNNDSLIAVASGDGTASLWDANNGNLKFMLRDHTMNVNQVIFGLDDKVLYTVSKDNTIKIWETKTGRLLCTLSIFENDEYIAQIPEGYYKCTPGAAKQLHYVNKDLKVITFEQLDVKYNRPDKVLEAIGCTDTALIRSYKKAYQKRIQKLGIDTNSFREGYAVPDAEIVNRNELDYEQKSSKVKLHLVGTDSLYHLDRFNVWVNEVPVYGQRGIRFRERKLYVLDTLIEVQLSKGENKIEVSVTNVNGTESYRIPLMLNYTPVTRSDEHIYFIGIGINSFAEEGHSLMYSVKDIRDMALAMRNKFGSRLTIDTLFNEKVSLQNVKALKQKLLHTTENDKVIISYSGHGLLSSDFDYYLSTYSVNFHKPEINGLPYDELENLLDSIPARKKILFIDACHSGEVDKDEALSLSQAADSLGLSKGSQLLTYTNTSSHLGLSNSFDLMKNLFVNVGKSTGAIIISAAAGNEFALERDNLQNGVFTFCILETMKKYTKMRVSELKATVSKRVEQITNGLQKPTYRSETISVDWEVW